MIPLWFDWMVHTVISKLCWTNRGRRPILTRLVLYHICQTIQTNIYQLFRTVMKLVPKGYLRIIGQSILDVCQLAWTLGRQWLWSSLKQDNQKNCTLDGIQMQLLGQEQKNTWNESTCGFDIGYSATLYPNGRCMFVFLNWDSNFSFFVVL